MNNHLSHFPFLSITTQVLIYLNKNSSTTLITSVFDLPRKNFMLTQTKIDYFPYDVNKNKNWFTKIMNYMIYQDKIIY